ncbi:MAG: NADH:flavin oxidoreductase [Dehalococcoidales bacterium]|nr:NADH:flavin oxidoreductase [Dehalococcoidales bacterium]
MSSKLLSPFTIRNLGLSNRIMRSATWDGTADETGAVTDRSVAIYRELGSGGIGLIVTGYAFVSHPLGQANPNQYGIYSDVLIPGWKRLVKAVREGGDSRIAMQIVHAGINSVFLVRKGYTLLAVSKLAEVNRPHREMTDDDIEGIINDFTAAAVRVREAGFDAVQLHGAHGYLMSQFASPLFNRRTDRWGGSPENRRRFHVEVVRRIRKAVGKDYPVLIKFGVQDDREGGMSLAEGLETCRQMVDVGIDGIEVSSGVGTSSAVIKEGGSDRPAFRERAAAVKKTVNIPVAVVHGIRSLKMAEEIIDSGDVDMVSMSRPFIREPHLVSRWQRGDIRPATCISCNKCFPILMRGEPLECGEERRLREEANVDN